MKCVWVCARCRLLSGLEHRLALSTYQSAAELSSYVSTQAALTSDRTAACPARLLDKHTHRHTHRAFFSLFICANLFFRACCCRLLQNTDTSGPSWRSCIPAGLRTHSWTHIQFSIPTPGSNNEWFVHCFVCVSVRMCVWAWVCGEQNRAESECVLSAWMESGYVSGPVMMMWPNAELSEHTWTGSCCAAPAISPPRLPTRQPTAHLFLF